MIKTRYSTIKIVGSLATLLLGVVTLGVWPGDSGAQVPWVPGDLGEFMANPTAGHLVAGKVPSAWCVGCHGPKNSPSAVDGQTGISEATQDPEIESAHVLHLTSDLLNMECTTCHVSVDLTEKSGAYLRRQVHLALCGTCHSPAPNAAHAAYSAEQCRQCHTGEHTSAPLYINQEHLAGDIDCTKCHGGEQTLFASRTEPVPAADTGSVSGLVALGNGRQAGTPIAGLTVEVLQDGRRVGLALTTGAGGTNYQIPDVPPGPVTVRVANPGHAAAQTAATVNPGQDTDADLTVQALATLPVGYSEISLPYNYVQFVPRDAAAVLGIDLTGKMAAVVGAETTGDYAVYPNAPADTFQAGRGYQINLDAPVDVVVSGAEVTTAWAEVPLQKGWNMVGQPYPRPLHWSRVRVKTAAGRVLSMAQARRAGLVAKVLWRLGTAGYEPTSLLEPYRGCWIYTHQDCTLQIPRN